MGQKMNMEEDVCYRLVVYGQEAGSDELPLLPAVLSPRRDELLELRRLMAGEFELDGETRLP